MSTNKDNCSWMTVMDHDWCPREESLCQNTYQNLHSMSSQVDFKKIKWDGQVKFSKVRNIILPPKHCVTLPLERIPHLVQRYQNHIFFKHTGTQFCNLSRRIFTITMSSQPTRIVHASSCKLQIKSLLSQIN